MAETLRKRLLQRHEELRRDFATWEPAFRDISRLILPGRGRWHETDANRGDELDIDVVNNTAALAAITLASGLMAGVTSPSRRWFRLTTPDPELADHGPVRAWLGAQEERIRWLFARSNFYESLADGVYMDLAGYGTAAALLESHPTRVLHSNALVMGEYFIASNGEGVVDVLHRELTMTVRQVVGTFAPDGSRANLSRWVLNQWDRGNYQAPVPVIQCIAPNEEYRQGAAYMEGKPFSSIWLEKAASDDTYLRKGGYEEFPAVTPRWSVRGLDAYGRGPGWGALGDARALQDLEVDLAELVDKVSRPPMKGSEGLRGGKRSLLPGDITYLPSGQQGVFEPVMMVPPQAIAAVQSHIERHEMRINRRFYADLWRYLTADSRAQRATATEVEAAREEQMLQLGPVLERLNSGLLRPAIDRAYGLLFRGRYLDPPPEELDGVDLRIEFESVMHQAQKSISLVGVRTLVAEVSMLGQFKPEAWDNVNADEVVQEISTAAGTRSDLLHDEEKVAQIRAARAQRQQAEDATAQAAALAPAAQQASQVDAPNLNEVLNTLGPVAAAGFPQAGGVA